MKKTYCDRCGKEIDRSNCICCTNEKYLRYVVRIEKRSMSTFALDSPVDLCESCRQILNEYCNHFMKELKENKQNFMKELKENEQSAEM